MTVRFEKPVYENERLDIVWPTTPRDELQFSLEDPAGVGRATGVLSRASHPPPAEWDEFGMAPPEAQPSGASLEFLRDQPPLPELHWEIDATDETMRYMMGLLDGLVEEARVPPAYVASAASRIMSNAFTFPGPRIHLGTVIDHYRLAKVAERLRARSRITNTRLSRGRLIVETDTLVVDGDTKPLAHTSNTGMYVM